MLEYLWGNSRGNTFRGCIIISETLCRGTPGSNAHGLSKSRNQDYTRAGTCTDARNKPSIKPGSRYLEIHGHTCWICNTFFIIHPDAPADVPNYKVPFSPVTLMQDLRSAASIVTCNSHGTVSQGSGIIANVLKKTNHIFSFTGQIGICFISPIPINVSLL